MHGRYVQNVLVRKSEGTILPGKRGSRWKDNIKIELKEMTLESLDGIHSGQRRSVVDTVLRLLTAVSKFSNIKFTLIINSLYIYASFQAPCDRAVEVSISLEVLSRHWMCESQRITHVDSREYP